MSARLLSVTSSPSISTVNPVGDSNAASSSSKYRSENSSNMHFSQGDGCGVVPAPPVPVWV